MAKFWLNGKKHIATLCFYHCPLATDSFYMFKGLHLKKNAQQTAIWPRKPKTFIAGPLQDSLPIPATTPLFPP